MRITGQIKVDRKMHEKSSVYLSVKKHIEKGTLIGIFPEGTRSPHKNEMLKAFTGVAQFALRHGVPIIPVGITGTYEILSLYDKRPNLKKIVGIHIGAPLHFQIHHGKDSDKGVCLIVTERVIKEVEKLSGKTYHHYERN
jgi:1-acyl-sn-glycerol-3-phosphate acyltransferase